MFGIKDYALSGLGDSVLWGIMLIIIPLCGVSPLCGIMPLCGMMTDYALSGLLRINSPERAVYHNDGLRPSDGHSPSKKKES
jgi:hypothetical protein